MLSSQMLSSVFP